MAIAAVLTAPVVAVLATGAALHFWFFKSPPARYRRVDCSRGPASPSQFAFSVPSPWYEQLSQLCRGRGSSPETAPGCKVNLTLDCFLDFKKQRSDQEARFVLPYVVCLPATQWTKPNIVWYLLRCSAPTLTKFNLLAPLVNFIPFESPPCLLHRVEPHMCANSRYAGERLATRVDSTRDKVW